jgi:hypothetical protein
MGGTKESHKELAAVRLATGGTVVEAATAAGVDPRTIYAWKSGDPEFRARIDELRGAVISSVLGKMVNAMTIAADVLVKLLGNKSPGMRWKAAKSILELGLRVREQADIEERLAAIEEQLRGERDGSGCGTAGEDRGGAGEPPDGADGGGGGAVPGGSVPVDA